MTLFLNFPARSEPPKNHASQYACGMDRVSPGSAGTTTSVNQVIAAMREVKRIGSISRSLLQLGCHYREPTP